MQFESASVLIITSETETALFNTSVRITQVVLNLVSYALGQFHSSTSSLLSGRTLLDWLCMHHGDGSTEEEAKDLCHRMLIRGLLHPFTDSNAELHGDCTVSTVFNVRPLSELSCFVLQKLHELQCTLKVK